MPSTLQAFLTWAATTSGAAAVTYLVIELLDKFWPGGLTGNQKFYTAFVLAVAVPVLAYLGSVGLGYAPFTSDGLWASILVTIFLAQTVHRSTSLAAAATPVLLTAATALQFAGIDQTTTAPVPSTVTTAPHAVITAPPDIASYPVGLRIAPVPPAAPSPTAPLEDPTA